MKTHPNLQSSQNQWLPESMWQTQDDDPVSNKTPLKNSFASPAIPQRFPPTPPTGGDRIQRARTPSVFTPGRIADSRLHGRTQINEDDDEAMMEAELMEHEWKSLDWVFKCATITLLVLILIVALGILIQGRSIANLVHDPALLAPKMPGSYKYDPRLMNTATLPIEPDMYGRIGTTNTKDPPSRLSIWVKTSGLGKTGYRLVGVPAVIIKSVLTVVWAPIKYILSKLVSIAYICLLMSLLVLVIYWVLHGFLTQTLGDWFMTRLNLPAPKALVRDFSAQVGRAFFNRWWSLTEVIKENIMTYFNCNLDSFNGGYTYGTGTGLGSTPNPMLRRRGSVWGSRYRGMSIGNANRPSIHYPKPTTTAHTGITGMNDQKRRLNTINETHDPLLNRAGQYLRPPTLASNPPTIQNGLFKNNNVKSNIYNPIGSNVNKFSYSEFDKENDDEPPVYKAPLFGSHFSGTYNNPIASPGVGTVGHRPVSGRGPFGTNVANRNAERNAKAAAQPPASRFRGKRGGVAFNVG